MSKSDKKVFSKKVHVFKAGPQTSAQGVQRTFSADDLKEVANSYDPKVHSAPLVIGHSGDNDSVPAYGWIRGFSQKGDDLYADVEFTDVAKDLVKGGHYRKVSISFYSPDSPINPHKGKWSARHLALLGAAPPAVKGLEPFSFSEEEGVFDFAVTLSPDQIFDKDLGPTLLIEKSPLEMLKERLDEVKSEVNQSLQQLEQNQDQQTESDVGQDQQPETTNSADQNANPDNPNQQFSEMKKNLGREGAEITESAQKVANLETKAPENKPKMSKPKASPEAELEETGEDEEFKEITKGGKKSKMMEESPGEEMESPEDETDEDTEFEEGIKRRVSKGAGGQEVQVVEQVFEEGVDPMEKEATPPAKKKAPSQPVDEEEMGDDDSKYNELEYDEVSHKTASNGKVSFGTHTGETGDKVTGRSVTARSKDDSYGARQKPGTAPEEDRDGVTSDGEQDKDRVKTAKNSEQDKDRLKTAREADGDDSQEGRWAGQDTLAKDKNNDQFDDSSSKYPEKQRPGTSDGKDPHGRSEGPTPVSSLSEEDPDNLDMAVDVKSVKGNKTSRVIHQSSSDKRAPLKGGPIADHAEGGEPDEEGVVREPKSAKTSSGKAPRGREGGPTDFPTRSEEDPDDLDMAVDVKDATQSDKVRIVRQKSGEKASVNHAEGEMSRRKKAAEGEDPMTVTGKGSTYKEPKGACSTGEDEVKYGGMGSAGQARPTGFPAQIYKEIEALKKENDRLKKEFEEQKVYAHKQRISHYVENLYSDGKLTNAIIQQDELQSFCEGLEFGTLEFSEGETPTSKLFGILNRLPSMVHFGEIVGPEDKAFEANLENMDPHERALEMVKRGEASDYLEAIKTCLWTSN